jgi:hypothetical protein
LPGFRRRTADRFQHSPRRFNALSHQIASAAWPMLHRHKSGGALAGPGGSLSSVCDQMPATSVGTGTLGNRHGGLPLPLPTAIIRRRAIRRNIFFIFLIFGISVSLSPPERRRSDAMTSAKLM